MSKKNTKPIGKSLKEQILEIFVFNPFHQFNHKQISGKLGIKDKRKKESIVNLIELLVSENLLVEIARGKYKFNQAMHSLIAPPPSVLTGHVDMKQTGKAYIISPDSEEDVFVAASNTNHALHGDLVKVQLFPKRQGRKLEGEIIEIVERKKTKFVGIVSIGKRLAFLTPDDLKTNVDIFIHLEDLNNAKPGMKAIAELTEWPEKSNNPFGKIVHVLGKPGENNVEMDSILAQFDFPLSFKNNTIKEIDEISDQISNSEIQKRRDFRDVFTITIDPEDAKDFDDAISLRKINDDIYEVGVHIADVSYFVKEGTAIDKEAFERGTSVYLVDRVIPMLPEKLSNLLCSLRPNEDKLCFSAVFEMDLNGKITSEWFGKTIINSNIRFNYEEVQNIIEGGSHVKKDEILKLHNIALKLRAKRFEKGAINFKSKEIKFILDENSKPIKAVLKEQKESNNLVEEFMLLANRKVSEWVNLIFSKKLEEKPPFVYRIHDEPSPEKLSIFSDFLSKLGYRLDFKNRKTLSTTLNSLLTNINGKAEENMIENIAVRTMAKAVYSTQNIGHYGLGFDYYSHFTSPIRRYPDLMAHRLLEKYLKKQINHQNIKQLEDACKHCSEMEKKAAEAERESIKYKQVEYMADKIGENFGAVVSGVNKWGIFAQIDDIQAEGLIRMKEIGDDFFYLDEENYKVIGLRTHKEIRLGDRMLVKIRAVDLSKKQLDLILINHIPQLSEFEQKLELGKIKAHVVNNNSRNKKAKTKNRYKK